MVFAVFGDWPAPPLSFTECAVTGSDFWFTLLLYGPLGLPLLYVLTILLRVACHFTGVEIPALGRAFFTTTAAVFTSIASGFFLQYALIGFDYYQPEPSQQFGTLLLALVASLLLTTGLYRLLLPIRYGQALTLWLLQAGLLGLFLLVGGCCIGGMIAFWERAT